ncbi:MAG: hypothetical protein JNM89_00520 [Hyphomicrobiaceae bacterium]|nr:hypothetical protein [Hyphomicrobiaceae bacterium]
MLRRLHVTRPVRLVAAIFAGAGVLALAAPRADAGHNVFHIFTPAVEAGHQGFEALTGFNMGLPAADPAEEHGSVRAAHEIAYHRGVTDFWMTKIAFGIERESGGDYQLTSVASENVFRFTSAPSGPLDFGWFTAVSAGLASGESNSVEFGPIVSLSSGPVALVLNPFLEKTFGENREEGIAFAYAWRATYEIAERLSVGIEGYGEIENLGHAPPAAEQVHRIGPVLYLGHVHGARHGAEEAGHLAGHGHGAHESGVHGMAGHDGEAPDWHAEVGVLFGLTEATPDAALKVNIGADF